MRYLPNTSVLCLEFSELVPGIMTQDNYDYHKWKDNFKTHGRGGNGNTVLIEYESLPAKHKAVVQAKYGDPYEFVSYEPIRKLVKTDHAAREYYSNHILPDGRFLPVDYQGRYSRQADWLNMISLVLDDKRTLKEQLHISITKFWDNTIHLIRTDSIKNGLPTSERRLRPKIDLYKSEGYGGLIETFRFVQQNARKVDSTIERLIMALYCRHEKPYLRGVCKEYNEFMTGKLRIVDLETGELFDPSLYMVNGKAQIIHEQTVKNCMNKPLNRAIVDKFRMSPLQFATTHRPYMQRIAPLYAFSKITADDTSSPFKMPNGKRPATYKIFDVASGAMIALVMTRETRPDVDMIRRVLAQMLSLVMRNGWGMPAEIEVENALTSTMTGNDTNKDILTAGEAFPFVTFCAPRNPQEKHAETFIRLFKQAYQKHRKGFQHRPFARLEANRMNDDSPSHKMRYEYEDIERMERADMAAWNNSEHPNQDKYPGLTRWQVLEQCQNPDLAKPNVPVIMPYIGHHTKTSVRRAYVQVQNNSYRLESITALAALENKSLDAYWLPAETGEIPTIYLYQGGEYICTGGLVSRFQEAKAEQTEQDHKVMGQQKAYINAFDKAVKEGLGNLNRVAVTDSDLTQEETGTVDRAWTREDHEAEAITDENSVQNAPETTPKRSKKAPEMQENGLKDGGFVQEIDPEKLAKHAISML